TLPDQDGVLRRYPYGEAPGQPGILSFAEALTGKRAPAGHDRIDFGIDTDSIPRLSFVDALTGQFQPAEVRGRAVIVGATAPELGEHLTVPVAARLPEPVVQALAAESLLQGRILHAVPRGWIVAVTLLIGILFGLLLAVASARIALLAAAPAVVVL